MSNNGYNWERIGINGESLLCYAFNCLILNSVAMHCHVLDVWFSVVYMVSYNMCKISISEKGNDKV